MTPTTLFIPTAILLLTLFVHLPTIEATTNPADVWKTSGNYQIGYCNANVPGFNIPQAAYLQALLPTVWSHLQELLQDITLGTSSTHGYTAFFKTNSNLEAVRQVFQDIADGSPILTGTWDKNIANFTGPVRSTKPVIVCVNPGEPDTINQQQNCYQSGNAISVAHVGRHSGAVSLCSHFFDLPRTARRVACPLFDPVINRFVGHGIDFTRTQYAILVHELVHIYNIPEGMPEEVYDIQGAVNLDAVASFENAQNFAYYAAGMLPSTRGVK